MATRDFGQKLAVVLKAINLSRSRLAQIVGVDKSVVSRWASGGQIPSDHNLSLLTEAVARHRPGFERRDWDLDAKGLAKRLDALNAGPLSLEGPSIAVLPFANLSADPEQDYFADGIVEDIISALSRLKSLFVIARNSTLLEITLSGKGKTIELPDDSEILLSPGLKATLTNLDDPSHSVTLNITGSFHQTILEDGSIVTEYNGRNLLADPFIDNGEPGFVLAIGHFVDNDSDMLPPEGQGQIVNVIDLLTEI
jgi:transcriptional regulator with XRE-family HTH domain